MTECISVFEIHHLIEVARGVSHILGTLADDPGCDGPLACSYMLMAGALDDAVKALCDGGDDDDS